MVFVMGDRGSVGPSVVVCDGCIRIIETAKFFYVTVGILACGGLLVVFKLEMSISVRFDGGAVMVGLGGYNSTCLLRNWYLSRWNFLMSIFFIRSST